MTAAQHHGIHLAVGPVARELREVFVQHVVLRIIGGVHFLDLPGCVRLLDKLRV